MIAQEIDKALIEKSLTFEFSSAVCRYKCQRKVDECIASGFGSESFCKTVWSGCFKKCNRDPALDRKFLKHTWINVQRTWRDGNLYTFLHAVIECEAYPFKKWDLWCHNENGPCNIFFHELMYGQSSFDVGDHCDYRNT